LIHVADKLDVDEFADRRGLREQDAALPDDDGTDDFEPGRVVARTVREDGVVRKA
jgi:hypothetical protein